MGDLDESPLGATIDTIDYTPPTAAANAIEALTLSQLEHALDAHRRKLKIYESLKSLNDVIGTQYGDRVLFELLQNAHDAHERDERGEIAIRLVIEETGQGALLVANKGRAFTASNLEAIRNIGTSDKEIGEGIGNKGLGFRSVEALTDDVHIYSAGEGGLGAKFDGYCFRFATTEEIAARLTVIGATDTVAAKVAANVPRYLVPVPVSHQSAEIRQLSEEGYATVVALPLATEDAVELARKQVAAVLGAPAPVLLFLDRLTSLDAAVLETGKEPKRTTLTREVESIVADLPEELRMERVTLDGTNAFLVARQLLPKQAVLDAVRASITAAPPLKRWLSWKGDAVVSVAVPVGGPMLARDCSISCPWTIAQYLRWQGTLTLRSSPTSTGARSSPTCPSISICWRRPQQLLHRRRWQSWMATSLYPRMLSSISQLGPGRTCRKWSTLSSGSNARLQRRPSGPSFREDRRAGSVSRSSTHGLPSGPTS